jgi:riboflavin kinase/FMN adenylyltransferase
LKVFNHINEFPADQPTIVTIGTFDGVHIGHRKILNRLISSAKKNQYQSLLLTFFPHPRMVLQQSNDLKLINTMHEKELILKQTGLDNLVVHPFSKSFSRLTAYEYVKDILVDQFNVKEVIIGYDHRFGRNRTADINDLKKYGEQFGFKVDEITKQEINDVAISSTKIRKALLSGEIKKANGFLQDPFFMSGTIVKGYGRGKDFGFPTANLSIDQDYKLIPKNGVYLSYAYINDVKYFGLTNIGTNPTVNGDNQKTIETYFVDFEGNLYDENLNISLLHRIRDEKKFESIDKLKDAMHNDKQQALNFMKSNGLSNK